MLLIVFLVLVERYNASGRVLGNSYPYALYISAAIHMQNFQSKPLNIKSYTYCDIEHGDNMDESILMRYSGKIRTLGRVTTIAMGYRQQKRGTLAIRALHDRHQRTIQIEMTICLPSCSEIFLFLFGFFAPVALLRSWINTSFACSK